MCMVEMAIFNIQREIRTARVTVNVFCTYLMVLTFVSSFMKMCQVVLKLWSGHINC